MSAGFNRFALSEDSVLASRIQLFLASQPRPALRYLHVEARGSTVTLSGLVTTFYERQLALQCSRRVAGVRELVDEIIVKEIAPQPRAGSSQAASCSEEPLAAVTA